MVCIFPWHIWNPNTPPVELESRPKISTLRSLESFAATPGKSIISSNVQLSPMSAWSAAIAWLATSVRFMLSLPWSRST